MKRLLTYPAVLTLLITAGCGGREQAAASPSIKPAVFQVTGKFSLTLPDFTWNDNPPTCWGRGGYDDLNLGAQVVVSDPAGATIAVGAIVESIPITEWDESDEEYRATACTLRFRVLDVPAGKGFYGVEVSHRGTLQYPESEAHRELELTIG